MKEPRGKVVLYYVIAIAAVAAMIGIFFIARKIAAAAALTTSPGQRPWVFGSGLVTMWATVAAARIAKRMKVFQNEEGLLPWVRVAFNFAAVAAIALGFFAALFNLPGEGNVLLRFILVIATMGSGPVTFRLAVF